jgi:hypothetical protein
VVAPEVQGGGGVYGGVGMDGEASEVAILRIFHKSIGAQQSEGLLNVISAQDEETFRYVCVALFY